MFNEEIKPIKGYEGLYSVSNYGYVISLAKTWEAGRGVFSRGEIVLHGAINSNGYPIVNLCKNGKQKTIKIHHLVWDHFGDKLRNGMISQLDHIDNIKANPRIDNLQLLTQRANCSKGIIHRGGTSSKYIGVSWHKLYKKWIASIRIKGKPKHLGYFTDEEEASETYQKALQMENSFVACSL